MSRENIFFSYRFAIDANLQFTIHLLSEKRVELTDVKANEV